MHRIIAFASITKLASFLKVSIIFGAYTAGFSALNCIMPLSGAFCGIGGSSLVALIGLAFRLILRGSVPLHFAAYHIPGLFGAYYWGSHSVFIRVLVPLACMALFIAHPVGSGAWIYAMYWLIPVALYFMKKSTFNTALGSTFVVHAVGSVIWLYTRDTSVLLWHSLLPIVLLERMAFAIGMVLMHRIMNFLFSYQIKSQPKVIVHTV